MNPESYYQNKWCDDHSGKVEHVLQDKTRVDCLTQEYAVEVEFADKWYEVGQALFYAQMTNKKPGVVLIMENPEKEYKYLIRLLMAVQDIDGFRIWVICENNYFRNK